MKTRTLRGAIACALLAAGCAAQPATAPGADPLGLGDAVAPRYQTLAASATPVGMATVSASSTGTELGGLAASASTSWAGPWFDVAHVTDGNLHSAWQPAAGDEAPSLTLDLGQATALTGLGIKLDAGATFDVLDADGRAIVQGVAPQYRMLDFVALPGTTTSKVKLVFHVQASAKLLVCEVKLFQGGQAASPTSAPSTTPTTPPSTMPTPMGCITLTGTGTAAIAGNQNGATYMLDHVGQTSTGVSGTYVITSNQGHEGELFTVSNVSATADTVTVTGVGIHGVVTDTLKFKIVGPAGPTFSAQLVDDTQVNATTGETFHLDYTQPLLVSFTASGSTAGCEPPAPCIPFDGDTQVIPGGTDVFPVDVNVHAAITAGGPDGFIAVRDTRFTDPLVTFHVTSITNVNGEYTFKGTSDAGGMVTLTGYQDVERDGHLAGVVIDHVSLTGTAHDEEITPVLGSAAVLGIGSCNNPMQ